METFITLIGFTEFNRWICKCACSYLSFNASERSCCAFRLFFANFNCSEQPCNFSIMMSSCVAFKKRSYLFFGSELHLHYNENYIFFLFSIECKFNIEKEIKICFTHSLKKLRAASCVSTHTGLST